MKIDRLFYLELYLIKSYYLTIIHFHCDDVDKVS